MPHTRRRFAFALLAYSFAAIMVGTTLPTPMYALYSDRMHFAVLTTTVIYATYAGGVLVALLAFGRWSDAVGRRPMLLAGTVCALASAVVFLTADAFGILPPIARLSRDQALYWFLSGFTSKLAGTEIGVNAPQPTFSACFGAPFLPQAPSVYARLLGERLDRHGATVWLVSTGWTGGPYGEGHRMPIAATRALLRAALSGELAGVEYRKDPVFGFDVPVAVPGVQAGLLNPRLTWADPTAYDTKAHELAQMFRKNFERFQDVAPGVAASGPRV